MSRRPAVGAACLAGAAVLAPAPVAAHAIGGTFTLPVPLWLYLMGAGAAVAASFAVVARSAREGRTDDPPDEPRLLPPHLATVARIGLRVLGMVWWYGAIVTGFVAGEISPLPAVLLWTGIWVGLPIVAVLAGNPWPSLSPFRTTLDLLEWVALRFGVERLDFGRRYPQRAARWPAVGLLAAGIGAELILPGRAAAGTVATLMVGYTILTLAGMLVFGPVAWLRHAELFEVMLGWFGRIGPLARRSRTANVCAGCGEACDPDRCVDCPECSTAAEDGERVPGLRPWVIGLTDVGRPGWSDVAFILLVLAGVTYDGLGETIAGSIAFTRFYEALAPVLGPTSVATFVLVEVLQLATVFAAFALAFVAVTVATRAIAGSPRDPLGAQAGRYATTLLPIAAGYLIAHYLTLVVQGVLWLPTLVANPLNTVAPPLDAIPVAAVWYLSVAAIVGGHIAGIVLAHRWALLDAPRRATLAGLPMVALMIGYTVLSLWIIATPIVVDPGTVPAAVAR